MPHLNYKIDFTAEVFVVHKNKVLLRLHDKYNKWLGVGGHIDLGEDPNEAAMREVKEEVGLDIRLHSSVPLFKHEGYRELIPPAFMNRHGITQTHEHVSLVFFAVSDTDELHIHQGAEKAECRWFTKEELDDKRILQHIRDYAKAALNAVNAHPK